MQKIKRSYYERWMKKAEDHPVNDENRRLKDYIFQKYKIEDKRGNENMLHTRNKTRKIKPPKARKAKQIKLTMQQQ